MHRIARFLAVPPLVLPALVLFSFSASTAAESAAPVRIGVLAPLSGPFASGGAAIRILDRFCIFKNGTLIHEGRRREVSTGESLRSASRRFSRPAAGKSLGKEDR